MRPTHPRLAILLGAGIALALSGCASTGLVIDPPAMSDTPTGTPVRIGKVKDARVFTKSDFAAPVPSTRGDAGDPEWTRRVFGRNLVSVTTLGGDRFTTAPGGVPELVRGSIAAGLERSGRYRVAEDAPDAARLDATIESFWVRAALRSASAKLIYEAEIVVAGDVPGLDAPVRLQANGSIVSGAADGVLWRRGVGRALEELAGSMERAARGEAPAVGGGDPHDDTDDTGAAASAVAGTLQTAPTRPHTPPHSPPHTSPHPDAPHPPAR